MHCFQSNNCQTYLVYRFTGSYFIIYCVCLCIYACIDSIDPIYAIDRFSVSKCANEIQSENFCVHFFFGESEGERDRNKKVIRWNQLVRKKGDWGWKSSSKRRLSETVAFSMLTSGFMKWSRECDSNSSMRLQCHTQYEIVANVLAEIRTMVPF